MKRFLESLNYALEGIVWVFFNHPNFKIHILIGALVFLSALMLKFSFLSLAVLLLTIFMVLTAEMLNTAVEEITNLITVRWAKQAKIAKDVSAGMVLIAALGAVAVGILLFLPKI